MSEMNDTYVNEKNHTEISQKLKTASKVFFIIAGCFILLGIIMSVAFRTRGMMFGLIVATPAFPCAGIGLILLLIANARKINSYIASTTVPVATEGIKYVAKETTPIIGGIVKEIRNNIKDNNKNSDTEFKCPFCNAEIDENTKFCSNCGKELVSTCKNCGVEVSTSDKFCPSCGEKIK